MGEYCRCCKNFIEKKHRHHVDLFAEKATREGICEAVRKYGNIDVTEEDIGVISTSICRSCYLFVKGIMEKVEKFQNVCLSVTENQGAELKRAIADRSPSQTAVSPSVLPELKRMHRENSSPTARVSLFQNIQPKPLIMPVDPGDTCQNSEVIILAVYAAYIVIIIIDRQAPLWVITKIEMPP